MTNEREKYDIENNQERMIMALGKLQEAKDLINEADGYNSIDELLGTLPIISEGIGEQAYNLKKVLGIETNESEKGIDEHEITVEVTDKAKVTIIDNFDLFGQLDKFMTDDDFEAAKAKMMGLNYDINAYFADKFDNQY